MEDASAPERIAASGACSSVEPAGASEHLHTGHVSARRELK
jgi:hypothetical protein